MGNYASRAADPHDGTQLHVETVPNVPGQQYDAPGFPMPENPREAILDLTCTVLQSECGKIIVSNGSQVLHFDYHDAQSPFNPEKGDLLNLDLEILEDGKLRIVKFSPEEEVVWPAAVVDRFNRLTHRGVIVYGREEGLFSSAVCGSGACPRPNDVLHARMIRTTGPCAWRAIEARDTRVDQQSRKCAVRAMALTDSYNRSRLAALMEDANGITIEGDLNFGPVVPNELSEPKEVIITNTSKEKKFLLGVHFDDEHATKIFKLSPNAVKVNFLPGEKYKLQIVCDRSYHGIPARDDLLVRFKFAGTFEIARIIHVDFLCADDEEATPFGNNPTGVLGKIYRAPTLIAPTRSFFQFHAYKVPDDLYAWYERADQLLKLYPCLVERLSPENYKDRMKVLIYLQDISDSSKLAENEVNGVLDNVEDFLVMDVPDLGIGRPSISCFSKVIVRGERAFGRNAFEGRIVEIRDSSKLCIKFDPMFHRGYSGERVALTFKAGIAAYIRMHHAVGSVTGSMLGRILFPEEAGEGTSALNVVDEGLIRPKKYEGGDISATRTGSVPLNTLDEEHERKFVIRWFHPSLNARQCQAVRSIIAEKSRIPYLIYGPPGTGKTTTVIESVMQIFHMRSESRILIAVPTNSAGDLICSRLVEYLNNGWLRKDSVVRYIASQRDTVVISDCIRPYVVQDQSDTKTKVVEAMMKRIANARIVISTWHVCGNLYLQGIPPNHFTHVVIDEAGHMTEPQLLVPITLCPEVRVVLAGDPKQLGPVIISRMAKNYGLGKSLMQRLMEDGKPYQRDPVRFSQYGGFDPVVVARLNENYRSHPKILQLYSKLSYNGELVPRFLDEGVPDWVPENLKKHYPFLVVGCNSGVMQFDDSCPSPYNLAEAGRASRYVHAFVEKGGLPGGDIGVVTPYRKQAEKIRHELRRGLGADVKVGSVEEFQGSERKVIIVTTVQTYKSYDGKQRSPSFWANSFFASQNHTNVAISRAKNFLIVIGDPKLMAKDLDWRRVLLAAFEEKEKHYIDVGGTFEATLLHAQRVE